MARGLGTAVFWVIGWGIVPLVAGTCSDIMWADEGSLIVGEVQAATSSASGKALRGRSFMVRFPIIMQI